MRIKHFLAGVAITLLALVGMFSSPVGAQQIMRIYGTVSGTPIALLANSSGVLRVAVEGGALTALTTLTFTGGSVLDGTGTNDILQRNSTSAQRFDVANTYTSSINNELFSVDWQTTANTAIVGTRTAATGTARTLLLYAQGTNAGTSGAAIRLLRSGGPEIRLGVLDATGAIGSTAATGNIVELGVHTNLATSGSVVATAILPTYNQASGNAANTDLLINRTQTLVGSGAQYLIDAQVSGTSQFKVMNNNRVGIGLGASDPTGTLTVIGNGSINFLAQTFITSPADGKLKVTNNGVSTGGVLDASVDSTFKFFGRDGTTNATVSVGILQGGGTGTSVANVGANSCGTTAATIAGNQVSGVITVGATAGTQCRVTFSTAAPVARDCTVTDSTTTIATRATVVDTTNTDFLGAFVAGDKITYQCTVR